MAARSLLQPGHLLPARRAAGDRSVPVAGEVALVGAVAIREGRFEDIEAGIAPGEGIPGAGVVVGARRPGGAAVALDGEGAGRGRHGGVLREGLQVGQVGGEAVVALGREDRHRAAQLGQVADREDIAAAEVAVLGVAAVGIHVVADGHQEGRLTSCDLAEDVGLGRGALAPVADHRKLEGSELPVAGAVRKVVAAPFRSIPFWKTR